MKPSKRVVCLDDTVIYVRGWVVQRPPGTRRSS